MPDRGSRRGALCAIAAVLLASAGFGSGQQIVGEVVVKGPVVQNVGQKSGIVTWVSRRVAGQYRKEGGPELPLNEELYHSVELSNLEPGTRYQFNLNRYGADLTGSFTTAPSSEETPFSFIVFGDTRTRHDIHAKAVQAILKDQPQFVIHTGDLVSDGNEPDLWDKFFDIEKNLLRNTAFYPTPGNHEQNTPEFFRFFVFGHHYSFDWGSVHVAAIDSNEIGRDAQEKAAFRQEQLNWLQTDLAGTKRPLVFVWLHHPPFTGVGSRKKSAAAIADRLEPVLLKGRVAAVFSGHDHNYQRHSHAGIEYIVTGGAGAPLYQLTPTPETMVKGVVTDNYLRVRVKGKTAQFEAVDLEGKILDSFAVKAKINW